MSRQDVQAEIDAVLDRILENAEALKGIRNDPAYTVEREALEKTQESLMARVIHLNESADDRLTLTELKKQSSALKRKLSSKRKRTCSNKQRVP